MGWKNEPMNDFRIFDLDCASRWVLNMLMMDHIREVGMQSAYLLALKYFEGNDLNKIPLCSMYLGDFSLDVV